MKILEHLFRYVLEVLRPPPKAVISMLELLTRIARHSKEFAQSVATFPRLVSTIVTEFLPSNWNRSGMLNILNRIFIIGFLLFQQK